VSWTEAADGVFARRYEELDLTTGLVLGPDRCLVIDTRGDVEQGDELAAAVRDLTKLPWSVVYTHAHFDHAFGTAAFRPCDIWAHERCRPAIAENGEADRRKWADSYRNHGKPEIADAIERTALLPPDRLVADRAELDLGGRTVEFVHPGLAHTDHDLLVHVPDAGVLFAGDVVEHGPHGFTNYSFDHETALDAWAVAMDALLALDPRVVVPGHGDPVDAAFVRTHRDGLRLLHELKTARIPLADALAASPYPEDVTRAALGFP
jgi:glyoxylase-like metal-dependent hydrolase (beta-lactamase superfamily II)